MTQERWKQVEAVFEQTLELPLDQRAAFLQSSCDGDEELRREVQSLLDSHARAGSFIDEPNLFTAIDERDGRDAVVASGQLIGSYRVVRELGRGGMGAVYLAERADEQYQKRVAIKLIKRGMDTDAVLRRFRNERQILASFDHANIARLFDAGTTATGLPYFVMEYVDGVSIDKYCDAHALPVPDRLKLFREVCAAVAYAHSCGVIHRDIKSPNIVVTAEGVPKLVDFGIAKILQPAGGAETLLTTADLRPMTPQYASPEQVRGERLTPATDIYSLGVVLYELLTGQLPYRFVSQSPHDVARAITEQEPTRPSTAVAKGDGNSKFEIRNSKFLKGDLDNIVLKALRKEPKLRYESVEQLSEDIRRHLERRPIIARPVRTPARVWRWSRRNPILAGAAGVCLVLALAVVWLLREQSILPKVAVPEKSIALLPFENLSEDKANAYFADGIQEEILTRLSKIADLKVISRASTQRYKSAPTDLVEVAKQLGVANILEGSIQKAGDKVRVNVQLINALNDSHLWAEKFDRKLTDIFAVESEIAAKVADSLQAKLTAAEQQAIASRPTENSEAHQLYLKGLYYWTKFYFSPGFEKSRDYFQQAIDLDPNYAPAYVGLAFYYGFASANGMILPSEGWSKCEAAINKAQALDYTLAEAYKHGFATIKLYRDRDWPAAERAFRRAIELNPNVAEIRNHYAMCLILFDRNEDALTQIQRALESDPFSSRFNVNWARILFFMRQYDRAIDQFRKTIELDPNYGLPHEWLGDAYEKKGMRRDAVTEWTKALTLNGDSEGASILEHAYANSGFDAAVRALAQKRLERLQERTAGGQYVAAIEFATAYTRLGDTEQAFAWLAKAAAERNWFAFEIRIDPIFDPLRSDPRFEKIVASLTPGETPNVSPEKSIAVLPFENLSRDPDNAFFTDGVQDEILTALTRIADLKVISRTSVAEYKSGIARDLHEIGQQLGVAHVLEGSVQRAGNRVRVNVQLVDTHTDAHMWAQSYDREIADVFAIQSEIAKTIANQLQAKLSVSEQSAIGQPLTTDLKAFLLYNRAKSLLVSTTLSTGLAGKFLQAADLLNQAVARDPSFFLGYCQLANIHDLIYFLNIDHSPARLALADAAIRTAFRLRPNAGEAHLARSEHLYRGNLDYDGALAELDLARRTLPNDPRIFELAGLVQARQGKFEEALHNRQRALQLDPRNLFVAQKVAIANGLMRRYAEQTAAVDRCLAIDPNDVDSRVSQAAIPLEWKADPRPLHKFIDSLRAENPGALPTVADSWFRCALAERDAGAAEAALTSLGESTFGNDAMQLGRTFGEGVIARMMNEEVKAHSAFATARVEQEKRVQAQPNYGPAVCVLGLIDAGLGRKEDALREGRRAIELLPVEKDALNGMHMVEHFAIIAAWVGEKDLACEQLAIATRLPGYLSYGQLKLLPFWDPLRGDPRFEKIVASLAPK